VPSCKSLIMNDVQVVIWGKGLERNEGDINIHLFAIGFLQGKESIILYCIGETRNAQKENIDGRGWTCTYALPV